MLNDLGMRCRAEVRERRQRRVRAAARFLGRVAVRKAASAVDQGAAAAGAGQVRARQSTPAYTGSGSGLRSRVLMLAYPDDRDVLWMARRLDAGSSKWMAEVCCGRRTEI